MTTSSRSYPHPVLGNGDDVAGKFAVTFAYELGRDSVALIVRFNISNEALAARIADGTASYVVEVECNSSFYRRAFTSRAPTERIDIPAKYLREKVDVGFYVCSGADFVYNPAGAHADYGDASFSVDVGDVLALGGHASFIAEKDFDPLRPPIASFIAIREGTAAAGPADIDYEPERITIWVSKADWKEYTAVRGQKSAQGIIHGAIVLPVLVDVLHRMRGEVTEFEGKNWFERLTIILRETGLAAQDPFKAAQTLLADPISRSFLGMEALVNTPDDPAE